MSLVFKTASRTIKLLTASLCVSIVFASAYDVGAQRVRQTKNMPHVGTIKDYPATGLMTGCGNLYFYHASQATSSDANYVFSARGDASNAWMNLGGHDVRLQQLRPVAQKNSSRRFYYRFGNLRVPVEFESSEPEGASRETDDSPLKIKITLRQGRVLQIVKAVGSSDC